jgi:hypothetical protein
MFSVPLGHRVCRVAATASSCGVQHKAGEIAGGQNRSPRENPVLDARIIETRWVPVDDGAFHDVVSICVVDANVAHQPS